MLIALLLGVQDIETLIEQLRGERAEDRQAAEARLVERGAASRPALERASSSADPELAGRARRTLALLATSEERAARDRWTRVAADLRVGMARGDVEAWIFSLRGRAASPADRGWEHGDSVKHQVYALDGTWSLYVEFDNCLRSWEVQGFPDLRREIDPELYPHVRAVHASPKIGRDYDPRALIRAVNALHPLGGKTALRACEAYHRLISAPLDQPDIKAVRAGHRRNTRYDLEGDRIFLILRALFVRKDGVAAMPRLAIGDPGVPWDASHEAFPLFPLAMQNDVPLLLTHGYSIECSPGSPLDQIEYCRENGVPRLLPLSPGLPTEAADTLIASKGWAALGSRSSAEHVRGQALRALASIHGATPGRAWEREKESVAGLKVRWDAVAGDFARD